MNETEKADSALSLEQRSAASTTANAGTASAIAVPEVIQVLAEQAHISKRVVETGRTVIRKTVSERDDVVSALLDRTDVTVERVAVGRVVESPPRARQEGDTWILPILEEVLVVEKRLVLKEELHVRTTSRQVPFEQTVRLRTEHVAIDESTNAQQPRET
jgi:stress response protein YsnF